MRASGLGTEMARLSAEWAFDRRRVDDALRRERGRRMGELGSGVSGGAFGVAGGTGAER